MLVMNHDSSSVKSMALKCMCFIVFAEIPAIFQLLGLFSADCCHYLTMRIFHLTVRAMC
jgi:hypothetical protein